MGNNTKECTGCHKVFDISNFHKSASHKSGFKSRCKTCRNKSHRKWRKGNKEKQREYSRRWAKNNPDKVKSANTKWRKNNPDKVLVYEDKRANRDRSSMYEQQRIYRSLNKEKLRDYYRRYRARREGLSMEGFSTEAVAKRMDMLGRSCIYCEGEYEHADHFFPLGKNGPHAVINLVPSCALCNQRKQDKNPWQWMKESNITPRLSWLAKKLAETDKEECENATP